MSNYRGKTALITGASSGIGATFAQALAARGMNLILVARSQSTLQAQAQDFIHQYANHTEVISCDLSQENAAQSVIEEVQRRGLTVDLLVNNAGFGTYGPFESLDPQREHAEIMLNVAALVDLTHAFIPGMIERGSGGIINVASTAAYQPVPYMAIYGATKAFVLSFSEALWAEYKERGIRVLALCPGATATPFHQTAGEPSIGRMDTPENVVATGLRALEQGRSSVIPGLFNSFLSNLLPRIMPRGVTALVAKRLMQPSLGSAIAVEKLPSVR